MKPNYSFQFYPSIFSQPVNHSSKIYEYNVTIPWSQSIYISDLPTTVSRKYAYADDLAIMHADGDWLAVEGALSKDMTTVGEYLQTW